MASISIEFYDGGTGIITASFMDETGVATTPSALVWTLMTSSREIVNGREDVIVSPIDSTVEIVLSGNDLRYSDSPARIIRFDGLYNSSLGVDLPIVDYAVFKILDVPEPV